MSRRVKLSITAAAVISAVLFAWGRGIDSFDRSIPVRPGGKVYVDIELGSGVSFDKGSLEVTTHEADEVQIRAEVTGWGEYAVDIDVSEHAGDVRVIGRVDGMLHWMFGGPTIDVRVVIPQDFTVDARIDEGPLLLEDLRGGVTARVAGSEITLRRAEGDVRLISGDSEIFVEDVDGSLSIESARANVQISGVRGPVTVRTERGSVQIESATGRVDIATQRGDIQLERIHGDVYAHTNRGRIEAEDIEGDVDVRTERGRIEIHDLDGAIRARSTRGGISVDFARAPAGTIETDRGAIELTVPVLVGFDLDAQTKRGEIVFDGDLAFQPSGNAMLAAAPTQAEKIEEIRRMGMQLAAEVQAKVIDRIHAEMERVRGDLEKHRGLDPELPQPHQGWPWNGENAPFEWKPGEWSWNHQDWDAKDWGWDQGGWSFQDEDGSGSRLRGEVSGGGKELRVRTERGDIHIEKG